MENEKGVRGGGSLPSPPTPPPLPRLRAEKYENNDNDNKTAWTPRACDGNEAKLSSAMLSRKQLIIQQPPIIQAASLTANIVVVDGAHDSGI